MVLSALAYRHLLRHACKHGRRSLMSCATGLPQVGCLYSIVFCRSTHSLLASTGMRWRKSRRRTFPQSRTSWTRRTLRSLRRRSPPLRPWALGGAYERTPISSATPTRTGRPSAHARVGLNPIAAAALFGRPSARMNVRDWVSSSLPCHLGRLSVLLPRCLCPSRANALLPAWEQQALLAFGYRLTLSEMRENVCMS